MSIHKVGSNERSICISRNCINREIEYGSHFLNDNILLSQNIQLLIATVHIRESDHVYFVIHAHCNIGTTLSININRCRLLSYLPIFICKSCGNRSILYLYSTIEISFIISRQFCKRNNSKRQFRTLYDCCTIKRSK